MQPFVCFAVEHNYCYAVPISIQQNLTGRNARGARIHVTIPFLARSSGVGEAAPGGRRTGRAKRPGRNAGFSSPSYSNLLSISCTEWTSEASTRPASCCLRARNTGTNSEKGSRTVCHSPSFVSKLLPHRQHCYLGFWVKDSLRNQAEHEARIMECLHFTLVKSIQMLFSTSGIAQMKQCQAPYAE